jgi:hypothetical protein
MSDDDAMTLIDMRHIVADFEYNGFADEEKTARNAVALIERLKADNAELRAEVERLTLRWTSERPTVVGEYLVCCKSSGLRDENLFLGDDDTPIAWDDDWEFAGPIVVQEPNP